MAYKVTGLKFNQYLKELGKEYHIFAPVGLSGKGAFTDTDSVRYQKITSLEEIELSIKSNFSAKEILLPITETLFYFSEDNWTEPKIHDKKILLFLRSCDIHGIKRLDDIYLKNGCEDPYYKVLREKVRFCLIECQESFSNCFCVSMNTNITEEYDMFIHVEDSFVYVGINNKELDRLDEKVVDLSPRFVMENKIKVSLPEAVTTGLTESSIWEEYSSRCIGCGRCSFVCPTCSCFSMQDIFYKENKNMGERRRVWSSCMVDGFTDMAGGHAFRKKQGERMRFRVMHKLHDYKKRFGYHMCVGCGRCDDACPEYISISHCANKLNHVVEEKK
ncbi:anaerobic sulfite reductase subunit AsrA [Pelosinus sp. IPA-1]|uniref:anaerobic sulfite reductase subunit AsrA n=1 Tax=Pelosinus sp. IPA-1 TaxID=3029569 RepID=UPI00243626E4|nr:anaerobic sulfite reductase subunit AsrA [Pelosinus sp. IPA-1]GMB00284.1 anaerobic sulfite reductase subunit A [Pelosinus sp. IPA-1]